MESDAAKLLLPKLHINDVSVRQDQQQCVLRCSRAALEYQRKKKDPNPKAADRKLWVGETALDEANTRVMAQGVPYPTEAQRLGQLIMTFGKYIHCTFLWLLENDVGYVKLWVFLFDPIIFLKIDTVMKFKLIQSIVFATRNELFKSDFTQ